MARDRTSRPEAKPLRLFVAVDIPADVRGTLAGSIQPVQARLPRGRWTPPDNWHVTVKFLGRSWPRLVGWISRSVERVAAENAPFELSVRGLGGFPSSRRSRVLWAGLDDPGQRLVGLAGSLDDALAKEFDSEKRSFTPHLTVARFDPRVALGDELPEVKTRTFRVEALVLYRSHLRRPAPIYEQLGSFPLGG